MIYLLFFVSIGFALYYALIIGSFLHGWQITRNNSGTYKIPTNEFVSIIISVRNEESTITQCIQSILQNDHTNFELLVVNNGSTDRTLAILESIIDPRLQVITNPNGYKKESLTIGIEESKSNILLFTDGDCFVGRQWVQNMTQHLISTNSDMVLGPMSIDHHTTMVTKFQAIDMMAMMGVTCGGLETETAILANGGNIAFTKQLFTELGGYPEKNVVSGDDVFLVQKAKLLNKKIEFLQSREAIVRTVAIKTWNELLEQRKRWASKTKSYVSKKDKRIAISIFLFFLTIVMNIVLIPFTAGLTFFFALFQVFIKLSVDFMILVRLNQFFRTKHLLKFFIQLSFIQFGIFLYSGLMSILSSSFEWKGRKI